MTQTKEYPHENLELWGRVAELLEAGKDEEAREFQMKYIPLPVWGARVLKKFCGAEWLRNSGYDLSIVEARLGKDWIDK